MAKKKLGRGLSALIPEYSKQTDSIGIPVLDKPVLQEINIENINKNTYQPRSQFSDQTIQELAESIKTNGLIQPIVVRPTNNGRYELISGERRYRATILLGLKSIAAIVKPDVSDKDSMFLSLIENIQREDINPIEQAQAYGNIMMKYDYTQQELADLVGKSRSSLANTLRLLDLCMAAKQALINGHISEGHARALLHFKDHQQQEEILLQIINQQLNVRDSENLIKQSKTPNKSPAVKTSPVILEGCPFKASYKFNGQKGLFTIKVSSENDFERVKNLLVNA